MHFLKEMLVNLAQDKYLLFQDKVGLVKLLRLFVHTKKVQRKLEAH